jgi:cytochrome P450
VLGSSDAPTIDQLEELTYVRGIMKETLRMYPAAVGTARVALQDFEFKNVVIPKGTQVLIHWHNIHMDDKYFKNAKEFIPERWDDAKDPGFCYSPFGVGKRSCIGRRFAEIEMMYVLSMFLKRYNVKHSEKSKEIDLEVNVTLMAKTPIHLTFEMR